LPSPANPCVFIQQHDANMLSSLTPTETLHTSLMAVEGDNGCTLAALRKQRAANQRKEELNNMLVKMCRRKSNLETELSAMNNVQVSLLKTLFSFRSVLSYIFLSRRKTSRGSLN